MSAAPQWLDHAKGLLDGADTAKPSRMRIAAFLIRQALEDEVSAQCGRLVTGMEHSVRMRSRLLVLHVLDQTGFAGTAEYAWTALSRACHHHAYELPPTASELHHLLAVVTTLTGQRTGRSAD